MRLSKIRTIAIAFLAALVSSCAEEETVTLSTDCYISSVTLGQSRRQITVKASDGSDSTVYVTFDASAYPLRVDQLNSTIKNAVALPHGTETRAMLAEITASGTVAWKKGDSGDDAWTTWNESDSIDFSSAVTFRVWAADASTWRDYSVTLHVEDTPGDSLIWKASEAEVPWNDGYTAISCCMAGDTLWVMGGDGSSATLWAKNTDGGEWVRHAVPEGAVGASPLVWDGYRLWTSAGGRLMGYDGNGSWTELAATGVTAEIPLCGHDGTLWTVSERGFARYGNGIRTDEPCSENLPAVTGASRWTAAAHGDGTVTAVDCTGGNGYATVWRRSPDADGNRWWTVSDTDNGMALVSDEALTLCLHRDALVAAGIEDGRRVLKVSRDGGLTWKAQGGASLPEEAENAGNAVALVSDGEVLWCVSSRGIWQGVGGF